MEVLSLALLAAASGLLLKAKSDSKKEGFADSSGSSGSGSSGSAGGSSGSAGGSAGSTTSSDSDPSIITQQAVARPAFNGPLFSQTVRNKSPQDHVEYIETTTQKYNQASGRLSNIIILDKYNGRRRCV